MWNNTVIGVGETFYSFALWLLMYGVLGWLVESVYMSFCDKKIVNRGFIHGPICPIYGFGGILVHSSLKSFEDNWVALFFVGMILATMVEYMTAMLMIKVFGCIWWDYSNKPFNYKGILCLESSVVWGLYSIMEFAFLKDTTFCIISKIPYRVGKIIIISAFVYYMIDFIVSARKSNSEEVDNNILRFREL